MTLDGHGHGSLTNVFNRWRHSTPQAGYGFYN